jgi:hypothetical protein
MIFQISSFREINIDQTKPTLILCDIDETLLTWKKDEAFFFNQMSKRYSNINDHQLVMLARNEFMQYRSTVPPTPTDIEGFREMVQTLGLHPISKCMFLTARSASHHTPIDFEDIGIDYKAFDVHYTANQITKGQYIKKYIDLSPYQDVIFIDDNMEYLHSVLIEELGIRCFKFVHNLS